jgi:hypothetical protein
MMHVDTLQITHNTSLHMQEADMQQCGLCEAVEDQRETFLEAVRCDALWCIGRTSPKPLKMSDIRNHKMTMRWHAVEWYTKNLVQMARVCARERNDEVKECGEKRIMASMKRKLLPRDALSMPLPAALWRCVAEFAVTPTVFLFYAASVKYIPRCALTTVLKDLCNESTGIWPPPRSVLDRKSHSTLRCAWISSGFVCPYLTFADKSYGQDVFHLTQARMGDVRLMRVMCRNISRFMTDDAARYATRGLEDAYARVVEVQRARRKNAFADYREAISMRKPFFLPHALLGEPIRLRFGNLWGVPKDLEDPHNPSVFVVTSMVSDLCWECAVLKDSEFADALRISNTGPLDYQQRAGTESGVALRRRVAKVCEDHVHLVKRRHVHIKAMPYGDGYRTRIYFVREFHGHGFRPGCSLVTARFMCLAPEFHMYPAYKQPNVVWKHKKHVLPQPIRPMMLEGVIYG